MVNFIKQFAVYAMVACVLMLSPLSPSFALDFGDAPSSAQSGFVGSYPTLLADNGARHEVLTTNNPNFYDIPGGVPTDDENDGLPDAQALGDDNDGIDDEAEPEFIVDPSPFVPGELHFIGYVFETFDPDTYVNMWVDWNHDGDWQDPGEHVFMDHVPPTVGIGSYDEEILVPADAVTGTTFVRARISTQDGLDTTGLAPDGEVNDFTIEVAVRGSAVSVPVFSALGYLFLTLLLAVVGLGSLWRRDPG